MKWSQNDSDTDNLRMQEPKRNNGTGRFPSQGRLNGLQKESNRGSFTGFSDQISW